MAQVKAIILVLIGLVIVVAIVQNHQAMSTVLTFRFNPMVASEWRFSDISVYQLTFIAFFIGVVIMGFFGLLERFRLKKRIKALSRELENKDRELNSLRNLPITSDHLPPGEIEPV
jgi:uncharacterized membrane protein YciS (DUF1049 family)